MSVRRVMGIETEYGISSRGGQFENHTSLSCDVIAAAAGAQPQLAHVRWSYNREDPVHDARGYHIPRSHVRSDLLTDSPALQTLNAPQINGSRIYVDHAHPEYSSAEVMSPAEALLYDRAGDSLMTRAAQNASSTDKPLKIYRNNTDGKGASWGSHENYQVLRSVPFEHIATVFTAHAVSRQIFTGSGRVGIGQNSEKPGFQLTQRSDFFMSKIGLQTTFDRPIVNTRDESHSTDKYRRFHVIVGDSNRMDVPEIMKLGTTSLLLWALEVCVQQGITYDDFLSSITLSDPVSALHVVSHDLTLRQSVELDNGESLTAFQLQLRLRSWVYAVAAHVYGTDSRGEPLWPDEDTKQIIALWTTVLHGVAQISAVPDTPSRLALSGVAAHIEWFLKWQVLESMRQRKQTDWADPLVKAMDISWAVLDPSSLFNKVSSRTVSLVTSRDVEWACHNPPEDTRAYVRGQMLKNFPHDVTAVSWDVVVVSLADGKNQENPRILSLENPLSHTRETLGDTFTPAHNIEDVCARLSSR